MAYTPYSFSVINRYYGHWDIIVDNNRWFRIRGGPSKYYVIDERPGEPNKPFPKKEFKTVSACMAYICDELMFELIVVDGQKPQIIESWNI
jgi:hypothetical protein